MFGQIIFKSAYMYEFYKILLLETYAKMTLIFIKKLLNFGKVQY
jgi:hypothetical protein